MSIDALKAAQAYAQVARTTNDIPNGSGEAIANANNPSRFSSLVEDALSQTNSSLQNAEATANTVVTGDASLVDVVTAISAAEVSLEAAIAVRNRMIEAYQEIMRMPI